jgi:hypothetical protein
MASQKLTLFAFLRTHQDFNYQFGGVARTIRGIQETGKDGKNRTDKN